MSSFRIAELRFEQCLPSPAEAGGEDPCRIKLCVAAEKSEPDCQLFTRKGEGFVPEDPVRLKKWEGLRPLAVLKDGLFLEAAFARTFSAALLDSWKLQPGDRDSAEDGIDALLVNLKRFLAATDINPEHSPDRDAREDMIRRLLAAGTRYPEFWKTWKILEPEWMRSPQLSPAAKDRIARTLAIAEFDAGLEKQFADYAAKDPEFRASLKKIGLEAARYLYGGGDFQALESDELYAACSHFYRHFSPPEKDYFRGEVLLGGILKVLEEHGQAHFETKPPLTAMKARLEKAYGIYASGLWENWVPLLLMAPEEYEKAFETSLALPYKWDSAAGQVMQAFTDNLRLEKGPGGRPVYRFDMAGYSRALREKAAGAEREKLLAATAHLTILLFNPQTKLRAFWNGRYRELPSFAAVLNDPAQRREWESLLSWVQTETRPAESWGTMWHGIGMGFDIGMAGLGAATLGTGLYLGDPNWNQAGITLVGAGLGAAGGNAACSAWEHDDSFFLCDLAGAALGGGAGFLIGWGANALLAPAGAPPVPILPAPPPDPGRRNPTDEFGP